MNRMKDIQAAIEELPVGERRKLLQWIESRTWDRWERRVAQDIESGKLDSVLRRVRKNIRDGKVMSMP